MTSSQYESGTVVITNIFLFAKLIALSVHINIKLSLDIINISIMKIFRQRISNLITVAYI